MCGIAGLIEPPGRTSEELQAIARGMTRALARRGPDGADVWVDAEAGAAFGQTRLAIVDLSHAGDQPMASSCGRYLLTYNGEVYNAADLRAELIAAGRSFRGHSDTEAVVEAIAEWGLEPALGRFIGMFAFGLWDRQTRTLRLVRDRLGIKPLAFARLPDGGVVFASTLAALPAHPDFSPTVDRSAAAAFLARGHVPAPQAIWSGVEKIAPGMIVTVDAAGSIDRRVWWALDDVVSAARADPFTGSDAQAIDMLEGLLVDAVSRRLVSDVPLGAFLSGGVDSSTVTALMQKASAGPVRTFSIGFEEADFNEAPEAAAVARHLGTDHTELMVTAAEAMALVPDIPAIFDEPFADASQVPTALLSALTRRHVTVALSGDGGDELFAGYNRHLQARRLDRLGRVPRPLRQAAAGLMTAVPTAAWDGLATLLPASRRPRQLGEKLHKLVDVLPLAADQVYDRLTSHWPDPAALIVDAAPDAIAPSRPPALADPVDAMRHRDMRGYLPDDILTKVDRASMAASLEARVPLLDHRVVEFAWRLPGHLLIREGRGKWLLRRVLDRHVPAALIDRPKSGFSVPVDAWLRGPLKAWAGDLLSPDRLKRQGLVDPGPVAAAWGRHQAGRGAEAGRLWCVLMLSQWVEAKA